MSSLPSVNPIPAIRNPFPTQPGSGGQGNNLTNSAASLAPPPTSSASLSTPTGGMNVGQQNPQPPPHHPPPGIPVQLPVPGGGGGLLSPATASALEHYRLTQLYQYAMAAERLRVPPGSFIPQIPPGLRPELAPLFYGGYCRIDPRLAGLCRAPEEPKPQFSYIGLIAMAILSSPEKKLVLSDIYQYILDNYAYFRTRGPGWRNSIRHNLSLNDCFIKAGRSANGKGHYWAIHPANVDDFQKGDFRRRKAQRKVRRHMGLAVDDDDSPSPPPSSPPPVWQHPHHPLFHPGGPHHHPLVNPMALAGSPPGNHGALDLPATLFGLSAAAAVSQLSGKSPQESAFHNHHHHHNHHHVMSQATSLFNRKRQFDVASLLAPEKESSGGAISPNSYKSDEQDRDQSLSSPSPPPQGQEGSLKRSKIYKKAVDFGSRHDASEDDDDESIEVTEDDNVLNKSSHHHHHHYQFLSRKMQNDDDDIVVSNKSNDSDKNNHPQDNISIRKRKNDEDSDSSRGLSPSPKINNSTSSPRRDNMEGKKLGQCGTSSNDEEESSTSASNAKKSLNYSYRSSSQLNNIGSQQQQLNNSSLILPRNDRISSATPNNNGGSCANGENESGSEQGMITSGGLMISCQNNIPQLPNTLQMLNQQNLMNHAVATGAIPPLEILQAHHHLAQQQQQNQNNNHHQHQVGGGPPPPFPFGLPGGHQFLQQNPSLASLMLLSSKYREITMNAAAMKRPQQ